MNKIEDPDMAIITILDALPHLSNKVGVERLVGLVFRECDLYEVRAAAADCLSLMPTLGDDLLVELQITRNMLHSVGKLEPEEHKLLVAIAGCLEAHGEDA